MGVSAAGCKVEILVTDNVFGGSIVDEAARVVRFEVGEYVTTEDPCEEGTSAVGCVGKTAVEAGSVVGA